MAATLEEQAERARQGSRRKRDLAALRAVEAQRHAPPDDITPDPEAEAVFAATLAELRDRVGPATAESWLEPARCLGVREDAIAVGAPGRCAEWIRRRYGMLLGNLVRSSSAFRGVYVYEVEDGAGEGLL